MSELPSYLLPERAIIPIVTPASEEGEEVRVDRQSIPGLVDFVLPNVDVFFLLGTTGEGPQMNFSQKKEALESFMVAINRRRPVLVNVSAQDLAEMTTLAELAQGAGADGVVLSPLFGERVDPYEKITVLSQQCRLPITVYNNPDIQGNRSLSAEFTSWVVKNPKVVAVKDSSGDQTIFDQWLKQRSPKFHVLQGTTRLLKYSLMNGAAGYVLQSINFAPAEHAWDILMPGGALNDYVINQAVALREQCKGIAEIKVKLFEMSLIKSPVTFPKRNE